MAFSPRSILDAAAGTRETPRRSRLLSVDGFVTTLYVLSSVVLLSDKHPIDLTIGQELPPALRLGPAESELACNVLG